MLHNVLLFMPLGLVARGLGWPWRRTALLLLGLSVAIETIQGTMLVGRDASLSDVLSNVTGGMLGRLSLWWITQLGRPTERTAGQATIGVLALATVVWTVSGIGLQPALDGTGVWRGELLRTSAFTERFAGSLDRLTVNGVRISDGVFRPRLASSDSLAVTMQLTLDERRTSLRPAVIAKVEDADENLQVHVSQVGDALVLEARLVGSRWRLHTPGWRFDGAMAIPLDRAWVFRWAWRAGSVVLTSQPADGSREPVVTRQDFSVASGWAFIHPFVPVIGSSAAAWTAVWLAWWFGLLGWTSGWLSGPRRWLPGLAGLAGFGAVSVWSGLPVQIAEIALAAGAYTIAAGAALAASAAREKRN